MRRLLPLSSGLCILLAACAQPWHQAGASGEDFYRDNSTCLAMAGPGGGQGIAYNPNPVLQGMNQGTAAMANANASAVYEQCMLGKGWHHGSGGD